MQQCSKTDSKFVSCLLFILWYSFCINAYRILGLDCHSVSRTTHIHCFQLHQEEGPHPQEIQNPVVGYGIGMNNV